MVSKVPTDRQAGSIEERGGVREEAAFGQKSLNVLLLIVMMGGGGAVVVESLFDNEIPASFC